MTFSAAFSVALSPARPALPLTSGEGLLLDLFRRVRSGAWAEIAAASLKDLARLHRSHRLLLHAAVRSLDVTRSLRLFLDSAGVWVARA